MWYGQCWAWQGSGPLKCSPGPGLIHSNRTVKQSIKAVSTPKPCPVKSQQTRIAKYEFKKGVGIDSAEVTKILQEFNPYLY